MHYVNKDNERTRSVDIAYKTPCHTAPGSVSTNCESSVREKNTTKKLPCLLFWCWCEGWMCEQYVYITTVFCSCQSQNTVTWTQTCTHKHVHTCTHSLSWQRLKISHWPLTEGWVWPLLVYLAKWLCTHSCHWSMCTHLGSHEDNNRLFMATHLVRAYKYTHFITHTHTHTHTHTTTHTHTHTHMNTNTWAHTHTYTTERMHVSPPTHPHLMDSCHLENILINLFTKLSAYLVVGEGGTYIMAMEIWEQSYQTRTHTKFKISQYNIKSVAQLITQCKAKLTIHFREATDSTQFTFFL